MSRYDRRFEVLAEAQRAADANSDEIINSLGLSSLILMLRCSYASAGVDEVQVITLTDCTGGNFKITFDGQQTANIAHNASAATVKSALEALSNVDVDDIAVAGSAGGPWTLTFSGTNLDDQNVAEVTVQDIDLTGTGHTVAVTTTTPGEAPAATLGLIVQVPDDNGGWVDYAASGNMLTTSAGTKGFVLGQGATGADFSSGYTLKKVPVPPNFRVVADVSGTYTFAVSGLLAG